MGTVFQLIQSNKVYLGELSVSVNKFRVNGLILKKELVGYADSVGILPVDKHKNLLFIYDERPKAEYPFDILVDDAPVNLVSVKQPKLGILYSQPWNMDFVWATRIDKLSQLDLLI